MNTDPPKVMAGEEKDLGCCGYDELATKPATTRRISFSPKSNAQAKTKPHIQARPQAQVQMPVMSQKELGERPRVEARAQEQAPVKIQAQAGAGRLPEPHGMVSTKSVFDQPRGPGNQLNEVRMAGHKNPRVQAVAMGQDVVAPPPVPPVNQVEAILKREKSPAGLTMGEAGELALALGVAIENARLALVDGEQCIGLDDSELGKAAELRDGLIRFATGASSDERLEVNDAEITLIERVLECGEIYEAMKQAKLAKTMAFVAGGLVIGTVVLVLVS